MTRRISVVVLAVVGVLATPVATATNFKIWPGSACRAKYGSQQGDMDYAAGRLSNASAASRYVVCPILRDGTAVAYSSLTVRVNTPALYGMDCTAYCCDTSGASCDSDYDSVIAGQTNASLSIPAIDADENGSCAVSCTVPPGGTVISLKWEE